jgi:hypothetical protein
MLSSMFAKGLWQAFLGYLEKYGNDAQMLLLFGQATPFLLLPHHVVLLH